jgi:hypothetical protein
MKDHSYNMAVERTSASENRPAFSKKIPKFFNPDITFSLICILVSFIKEK